MARNEEKAQSMLNRFVTMKESENKKPVQRRPYLASECRDLADADKWRHQIMREITAKSPRFRTKAWASTASETSTTRSTSFSERDGTGSVGSGRGPGYRYFGAAKKLPGVRELFEKPPELRKRRTRYDIYKRIDAGYYGYRDEEDGVLEGLERDAEGAAEVVSVGAAKEVLFEEEEDVVEEERKEREREREEEEKEREFVVHVPLPDEKMVLLKKKMELLREYASEDLVQQEKEAKAMLNIHR
ncbi:hypothetical protein YC2023_005543 [Brassica napus]